MFYIFALVWFLSLIVFVLFLIGYIIAKVKKKDSNKYRNILVISLIVSVVSLVAAGITTPSAQGNKESIHEENLGDIEKEDSNDASSNGKLEIEKNNVEKDIDALKKELKEKYDVSEPDEFVKGDATGDWRIVKVANGTAPTEYAVEYAKAYMPNGGVHYIVNFTLKTTSQFRLIDNKLAVTTTEYVDKEEHDASTIGEGMLYTQKYYDMETGKEITTDADESAGTVAGEELISAVKNVIDGVTADDEVITDVLFDGKNLTVKVDLSEADTSKLSKELIAESRTSSITDEILDLDDQYYNTWETVTVDFGPVGSIVLDKTMVKDEGYGKFFDVPVGYFE